LVLLNDSSCRYELTGSLHAEASEIKDRDRAPHFLKSAYKPPRF